MYLSLQMSGGSLKSVRTAKKKKKSKQTVEWISGVQIKSVKSLHRHAGSEMLHLNVIT